MRHVAMFLFLWVAFFAADACADNKVEKKEIINHFFKLLCQENNRGHTVDRYKYRFDPDSNVIFIKDDLIDPNSKKSRKTRYQKVYLERFVLYRIVFSAKHYFQAHSRTISVDSQWIYHDDGSTGSYELDFAAFHFCAPLTTNDPSVVQQGANAFIYLVNLVKKELDPFYRSAEPSFDYIEN